MYNHLSRTEVIADVDLTWASDCDIALGIAGLGQWLKLAAVRDLYLTGTMRITLRHFIH